MVPPLRAKSIRRLSRRWAHLDLGDGQDEDDEGEQDDEGDWHNDHQCIESPATERTRQQAVSGKSKIRLLLQDQLELTAFSEDV